MRFCLILILGSVFLFSSCGKEESITEPPAPAAIDRAHQAQEKADAYHEKIADLEAKIVNSDDAECTCPVGRSGGTTWCNACNKGFINGETSTDKQAVLAAMED